MCFYLRTKIQKAPDTCPTESSQALYTSEMFNQGTEPVVSSWAYLYQRWLMQLTAWNPLEWWDCPHGSLPSRSSLLLYFSPSSGVSASLHLFFLRTHVAMLATVSADANQILPSFGLFTCLRYQMWSQGPVAQGSFSSSHWNWVFATYQVLKKLRTANREDRHRELFIYRGRHNPCVMDCSPCNEHLLPLARNVNNGTSEYKEQCKPLKTRANPLQLYVFTCWEVYSAR